MNRMAIQTLTLHRCNTSMLDDRDCIALDDQHRIILKCAHCKESPLQHLTVGVGFGDRIKPKVEVFVVMLS